MKTFEWSKALAYGNAGARIVRDWLKARGSVVQSVEKSTVWRKRDVDFVVDGLFVEVKTDSHAPGTVFAETTVDGKPGYIFKSRADVILYYFSNAGVIYWIDLPKLAWWVQQQKPGLKVMQNQSSRGGRTWLCEGVVVPLEALEAIDAVEVFRLDDEDADAEGLEHAA